MPEILGKYFKKVIEEFRQFPDYGESPERYKILRRNIIILMVVITLVPLLLMAVINYHQYQKALQGEVVNPIRGLLSKTKHSFELFLAERLSAVSFIASAYSYEDLADQAKLNRIFQVMRDKFGGFVDLGLINIDGLQVSYTGPYDLEGKNYRDQSWFQEVRVKGTHISDVFLGYRKFPHFVIAVQNITTSGKSWILRATIDTEKFNNLIASMSLDPTTDAFILNREGIFQTPSKFYGRTLDKFPLPLPPVSYEPNVVSTLDHQGEEVLLGYTYFVNPSLILVMIKPKSEVLKTWYTLKSELFFIFAASVIGIFLVVFRLTNLLVRRIEESDQKRKMAYHEIEYTNKLASLGRMAAGVAHEINNPMAIINEKAGLMMDLIQFAPDFPDKEKFLSLTASISKSVDRVREITHRLLGFARRMDVNIEIMNLDEVIKEVLGFLEKEMMYRNIDLRLQLDESLSKIASDRGQLQQVFLNILNNALEAVSDGGIISITSFERDVDTVGVSIQDNGPGMSQEVKEHIFEPFYTTKKISGTGLGLSITYGIVKKLGGEIEVQSKEGQGTTFTVILPKKAKTA